MKTLQALLFSLLSLLLFTVVPSGADALDPALLWQTPPKEARPIVRWWWPGGSVDEVGIRNDLQRFHDAGFGGVEVQPFLLGLSEADVAIDSAVRTVGEPIFFEKLAVAAREARAFEMSFDVTLGSGWPAGLPRDRMKKEAAERQLLMSFIAVKGPEAFHRELPKPGPPTYFRTVQRFLDVLAPFDEEMELVAVVAARVTEGRSKVIELAELQDITAYAREGRLQWQVPEGSWRIFAFYENVVTQTAFGAAYPGRAEDTFIVDHMSRAGASALLEGFADPMLAALPKGSLRGIFIDSFELMGELPWTGEFQARFYVDKGYDLTPFLPLLFRKGGETKYGEMIDFLGRNGGPLYSASPEEELGQRVREDYEEVRASLFAEAFLGGFSAWSERKGVDLRLQAHGGFADYLDTYQVAQVPESEALFAGGSYDFLKLASSAGHVAGSSVISMEAFIEMKLWSTWLSPVEYRLLAGRAFSAGITRLACHCGPYSSYVRSGGKPWYPFPGGFGLILAGPLPMTSWFKKERWDELPALNTYVSRLSYAMSRGNHVADVAWLHAERDFPDRASLRLGRVPAREGESPITRVLKDQGLVFDRVSLSGAATAVAAPGTQFRIGAANYRALLIDDLETASVAMIEKAVAIAESGVPVYVMGELPHRTRGLADAAKRDEQLRAAVKRLREIATLVEDEAQLAEALADELPSSVLGPVQGESMRFALDHRVEGGTHVLLLFNESYEAQTQTLQFQRSGGELVRWNPEDGSQGVLREQVGVGESVELSLGPAEAVVLTLGGVE